MPLQTLLRELWWLSSSSENDESSEDNDAALLLTNDAERDCGADNREEQSLRGGPPQSNGCAGRVNVGGDAPPVVLVAVAVLPLSWQSPASPHTNSGSASRPPSPGARPLGCPPPVRESGKGEEGREVRRVKLNGWRRLCPRQSLRTWAELK